MLNVFNKNGTWELHVKFPDGRMLPLEDELMDYERLLKGEKQVTSEPKDDKPIPSESEPDSSTSLENEDIAELKDDKQIQVELEKEKDLAFEKRIQKIRRLKQEERRMIEMYRKKKKWSRSTCSPKTSRTNQKNTKKTFNQMHPKSHIPRDPLDSQVIIGLHYPRSPVEEMWFRKRGILPERDPLDEYRRKFKEKVESEEKDDKQVSSEFEPDSDT